MKERWEIEALRERALDLFAQGYNCAQAVAGAWAPECGLSQQDALKLAAALGGGVASTHQDVCGALLGGLMAIGAAVDDPSPGGKAVANPLGKALLQDFAGRNGSCNCGELLRQQDMKERSASDLRLEKHQGIRPCARYVVDVVDMVHGILMERL